MTLILAGAALLGLLLDQILVVVLIASLLLLAWQCYRINQLYRWVRNPGGDVPMQTSGQIYQLHREISRRNKQERIRTRKLSHYLSQFRKAASVLPDAIVLIDESGKIEWANAKSTALLGVEWPRDRSLRFTDLVRDPQVSSVLHSSVTEQAGIDINLQRNRSQTLTFKCIRYTSELRMIIARDVSRLVKINQMHTRFVANVSHELKTPLTVLKGYLEILSEHALLSSELKKPVSQMSVQAERMQVLVHDLIYLSKLEEHADRSQFQPVDVTTLINAIIEAIQPVIEAKCHNVEIDIDYQVNIIGSPSELHSAFQNLISNAVNYTEDNGLVSVRWHKNSDGGATFTVADNGVGIPHSAIPNLTKRFFRVDSDRSRETGGTGLGLAIVKHVLQRHDARLEISSTAGVGSEFRCIFPARQISGFTESSQRSSSGL